MKVLIERFNITDFWFRYEFQHRGSPHVHGLFWFKDAPDISNGLVNDNDEFEYSLEFFDGLISTMNPDLNIVYQDNPCMQLFSDVEDNKHLEDYSKLVNHFQRHSKHFKYCFEKGKKECRFKFPKELKEESELKYIESSGQFEFIPKRNDELINPHSRFITEIMK